MINKKSLLCAAVACGLVGWSPGAGFSQSGGGHEAMGHGSMPGMSHGAPGGQAVAAAPQGVVVRESKVQGLSFVYRLYSWDERNAMMKGMEGHAMPGMDTTGKATNHLMVFIRDEKGKELTDGKVGFILSGPDKVEQKTLTMGMSGGYGADVVLKPGTYAVKTKAVFGGRSVVEDFSYTVK